MLAVLKDMDIRLTDGLAVNQISVTGAFLEGHGIEPEFVLNNVHLLQAMNENPNFLSEVENMFQKPR